MTVAPGASVVLPLPARLEFVHALVERTAAQEGCRVLHLKGRAAAVQLGLVGRRSVDVDVWLAPAEAARITEALLARGWQVEEPGRSTALYRHATVLSHRAWGCTIDVHHRIPGVGLEPDMAFALAWEERELVVLGGHAVSVPGHALHGLVMLLHAARNRGSVRAADDVRQLRTLLAGRTREIVDRAEHLACSPAMLAALPWWPGPRTGRGRRLPPVAALWLQRLRETPTLGGRLLVLWAALLPDRTVMSRRAGRPLGGAALALAWVRRWGDGLAAPFAARPDWPAAPRVVVPTDPVDPVEPGLPARSGTAPSGTAPSGLAWWSGEGRTYVADLDAVGVTALNRPAALVWHAARAVAEEGERPALPQVIERVRAALAQPVAGLEEEVERTLADLRSRGLLRARVMNHGPGGPP